MNNVFNNKALLILTLIVTMLSIASYFEESVSLFVILLSGCIYTVVLYLSLNAKPDVFRFLAVFFILGIVNYFSMLVSVPLEWLPKAFSQRIVLVLPSLFGALITILCIHRIWRVKLFKKQIILSLVLIGISSLVFNQVLLYIQEQMSGQHNIILFNNVLWWLMFSSGIIFGTSSVKK